MPIFRCNLSVVDSLDLHVIEGKTTVSLNACTHEFMLIADEKKTGANHEVEMFQSKTIVNHSVNDIQ